MKQVTKYYPDFDSSILFDTAEGCKKFEEIWKPLYDLADEIDDECSKHPTNDDEDYYTKIATRLAKKFAELADNIFPNILKWSKKNEDQKEGEIRRFIENDDLFASDLDLLIEEFCEEGCMYYNPKYWILGEIKERLIELTNKDTEW